LKGFSHTFSKMLACIEGPSIGLVARFLNSNLEAVKVILNPTYATSLLYLYGSAPVNKKNATVIECCSS